MSKVLYDGKTYIEQTPDVINKLDNYDSLKRFRDKLSRLNVTVHDTENDSKETYSVSVDNDGNFQITETGTINPQIELEISAAGS